MSASSDTVFTTIIRFLLQTFIIVPIVFITSVTCTLIGGAVKYLTFNLISKPKQIYILQEIYKSFGEVEWFAFEFWTDLRYVVSTRDGTTDTLHDIMDLNTLIIGNHSSSLFDFIPLGSICDKMNRVSKSFVFIKKEVLYYPVMGWVEAVAPHGVTLNRDWNKDKIAIAKLSDRFNANIDFKWVTPWVWFIFPEGTRFDQRKLLDAQQFARDRGYPVYKHLLQPRVKGFSYLTHHLHESLGCVVDATILYKDKPPSVKNVLLNTRFCKYIHIHLRIYKQKDIPKEIEQLDQWLRDRWTEKDEILQNMKDGFFRFKPFKRSPWRAIQYYMFYAIWSTYLVMNLYSGYPIWSTPFMITLACAVLPVLIVLIQQSQNHEFGKKA
eukprot:1108886_1